MAVAKLSITLRNADTAINRLEKYVSGAQVLPPKFQHFIAEMVMLRLFSIFESSVAEIAYKLAAGATYTNGNAPTLNVQAGSMLGSRSLFLAHGRQRARTNLQWTKASYIRESVEHVIPPTEIFIFNIQANGQVIEEMRKVRNILAHRTSSAASKYRTVLRQSYGANVQVTPGAFLTSTSRSSTTKLAFYLASTRAILNDAARGS